MDYVYDAVVVLHFLGLASLIGGFLVQMSTGPRGINNAMLHGAITQVVTGLVLVGMRESDLVDGRELDMAKIGVKLVVAVAALVAVLIGRRRPEGEQQAYWATAGGLGILNVIVAVFW